jgi:peptidyl-prolyl cis-trans isomerase D
VRVNGERVSFAQYRAIDEEISRYYTSSPVKPEKPRAQLAVEQAIEQELARQLAGELGLWTEDSRVDQVIIQQMSGGTGVVNEAVYRRFLQESGFQTSDAYREFLRNRMNVQLALAFIRATAAPSEQDIERRLLAGRETRRIELLAFESEDYLDQVESTTEEVRAYFEEHRERYRLPERMKLDYLELTAEDLIDEVSPEAESMERWFRSERENYLIPAERDVRAVVFGAGVFRDRATFTEEELQKYYEDHRSNYVEPEKYRVRFAAASVEVPDASIQAVMEKRPEEFKSESEAVSARHILIRTDRAASPETLAAAKGKADEIRARIRTEEDFIGEAKAHSEDVNNSPKGGDLGFFEKGRMVPEFEVAAFSLPEGTVSQPIKTAFGYHLIWVTGHRAAGEMQSPAEARFRVLQEIDQTPLKRRAREQLESIEEALAGKSLAAATAVTDLPVVETDWFSTTESPHPQVAADRIAFNQTVPTLEPGGLSDIVEGFTSYYLIESIEKKEQRQQTYEEVRGEVETAYRTEKAVALAKEYAQEAADRIREGSLTFDRIASTYGLSEPVLYTQLRAPGSEALQKNVAVDREIVNRAFSMEPNTVEGPFDTLQGPTLIEIVRDEAERLPEFEEVREEVEAAYGKVQADRLANEETWKIWSALEDHNDDLAQAAAANGYAVESTDFFRPGFELAPGFPQDSVANFVAAGLRVEGATSEVLEDPPPDPENPDREIRAYLILQAATIEASHLPDFEEVAEVVREDVERERAAALASEEAQKGLEAVTAALAAATAPVSASRSIDLRALATENGFEVKGPLSFPYAVNSPSIAGQNSAAALSSTVYALPLGGVSGIVAAKEHVPEGSGVAERNHGYYLAQVVDIDQPATGGASRGESFRELAAQIQDAIQTDWSDRARRLAEIKLNENLFDEGSVRTILEALDKS